MKQQWCGKIQLSIHPQKFQHVDQNLIKPSNLDEICWQGTEIFLKCRAAKCTTNNAAKKKIKYVLSAWVTTVPDLLAFYSIL
jgi:hypothetical protein